MNLFYECAALTMRVTLRMYFKKIRIEGRENVPTDEPLLVTPNHQNAFLDPFISGSFAPLPFHFLTRQDVFVWWSKPILKMLNMMPIYRIRDGYAKLSQNDAVFETCKELFNQEKPVLIFPEGNHGEHHFLRPLTKGAARIALFSQQEMEKDLKILPVGINYFDHKNPQTGVVLVYGEPISVKPFVADYEKNGPKALLKLKEAISEAMKKTLVIPEETPDYELKKRRIFNEANLHLSFEELRNFPYEKGEDPKPRRRGKIARILNPLPFFVIKRITSKIKDPVFLSSVKYAIGVASFPIWWLIVLTTLSLIFGIQIGLLTVFVMVFGLFYSYS